MTLPINDKASKRTQLEHIKSPEASPTCLALYVDMWAELHVVQMFITMHCMHDRQVELTVLHPHAPAMSISVSFPKHLISFIAMAERCQ